jgi:hypothetical protein
MGLLEWIGAAFVAIVGALLIGRKQGARDAQEKAKGADHDRARYIEDAADRARRADDGGAVDRLHDAGRLRD